MDEEMEVQVEDVVRFEERVDRVVESEALRRQQDQQVRL
jgi:hypothetical protein